MPEPSDAAQRLTRKATAELVDELTGHVYAPYRRIRSLLGPDSKVLDVGCGNAKVSSWLAATGALVDGIEPSPLRSLVAAGRLHYVSTQWVGPDFHDEGIRDDYDVITFLDVLEHLVEPEEALAWATGRLAPGGRICALIPNSAHWSFRLKVLRGDWSYEDSGLFDRTHLRFFDPDTMALLRPEGTSCVGVEHSSFGRWSHPRLVRWRPRLFAAHVLVHWQRTGG